MLAPVETVFVGLKAAVLAIVVEALATAAATLLFAFRAGVLATLLICAALAATPILLDLFGALR